MTATLEGAVIPTDATAPTRHPLLAQRWSTRAFDASYDLSDNELAVLLEAARWAPSAANSQPWRFLVARRGTPEHAVVFDALAAGNQTWAGTASALIVIAAVTEREDGSAMRWSSYDAGQAAAHLSVQAQHEGLSVHQMGGFDATRLGEALAADGAPIAPLTVIAVGRHDAAARLPESLAARESAPRERHPIQDLTLRLRQI